MRREQAVVQTLRKEKKVKERVEGGEWRWSGGWCGEAQGEQASHGPLESDRALVAAFRAKVCHIDQY